MACPGQNKESGKGQARAGVEAGGSERGWVEAPGRAGHTSAAWAAAPRLNDLQRTGQVWALQPCAADLAALGDTHTNTCHTLGAALGCLGASLSATCMPFIPHSDSAHSCPGGPQIPPCPSAPGLDRCSLQVTMSRLGAGLLPQPPFWPSGSKVGGLGCRAAHCGRSGRDTYPETAIGTVLAGTASSGSSWNLPGARGNLAFMVATIVPS